VSTALLAEDAVPLAKLSERFYQKFGHDLVGELVAWLNQVETNSRSELRDLNELNFSRLDSKLEQRVAELRGEFRAALETQTGILLKWMLGIWVATIPALATAIAVVQHFLPPRP